MGRYMTRTGTRRTKIKSGYVAEKAVYRVLRREGHPLQCWHFKAKKQQRNQG